MSIFDSICRSSQSQTVLTLTYCLHVSNVCLISDTSISFHLRTAPYAAGVCPDATSQKAFLGTQSLAQARLLSSEGVYCLTSQQGPTLNPKRLLVLMQQKWPNILRSQKPVSNCFCLFRYQLTKCWAVVW